MIKTFSDLKAYIKADYKALKIRNRYMSFWTHDIWTYQRNLRYVEYFSNRRFSLLSLFFRYRFKKLGLKLGFSIPPNVFGKGLSIAHYGTIVVNKNARIGENCRIHICVNIGSDFSNPSAAPLIGNNCYIAPGVKIFGGITIADNTKIGANSVVNKSFLEPNKTIVGVPGRQI